MRPQSIRLDTARTDLAPPLSTHFVASSSLFPAPLPLTTGRVFPRRSVSRFPWKQQDARLAADGKCQSSSHFIHRDADEDFSAAAQRGRTTHQSAAPVASASPLLVFGEADC
ncbi:unnamed protein product [Prorocentrum cordatum]|uniref:Uncharacterized protein n=1 Tax=Prorocentrum cordatum TaxID=2364126 RepID=A0ABN9QFK1_9DINO|nr:unnamed protein product [Polarella glacialis]